MPSSPPIPSCPSMGGPSPSLRSPSCSWWAASSATAPSRPAPKSGLRSQLAAAVEILNAPVAPAPAPGAAPAPVAAGTYATEAARADAALKQLLSTAESFGGTDAGLRARYYAASLLRRDQPREGRRRRLRQGARPGRGLDAARPHGRRSGWRACRCARSSSTRPSRRCRNSSQRRDGPLPVDAVLVQLAEAYQQAGRAAEASQTLQRVIDEFPQSPYAADARQRVEALQASVAKAS